MAASLQKLLLNVQALKYVQPTATTTGSIFTFTISCQVKCKSWSEALEIHERLHRCLREAKCNIGASLFRQISCIKPVSTLCMQCGKQQHQLDGKC